MLKARACCSCSFSFWQAEKQAELNREEEEQKAKAARKEARRAARLAAAGGNTHTASTSPTPSPSPAAGATRSWDSNDTSSVSEAVDDDKKVYGTEDEDEDEDDDAAALRASLQLAAELQRAEDLDTRVPKRKRVRPETFVAEPSKQLKAEPSPKDHVRMTKDETELAAETEEAQSEEDDEDMIALSSDDESFSGELQQPKAKKAKRETKPKVLTEVEHAAEVMRPSSSAVVYLSMPDSMWLVRCRWKLTRVVRLHCCARQVEQAMWGAVEEDDEIDEDEYFMRKFLLEQVSLSLPPYSPDSSQTEALAGSGDNVALSKSSGSADLGSPAPLSAKPLSKTPPKPRLKTPRKRRSKLNLEANGPTTTARMVAIENYKDHVKGNVMIRAKAYVPNLRAAFPDTVVAYAIVFCDWHGWLRTECLPWAGCSRVAGTDASGKVEDKLTSGRENRLKSRGLSSAIGRARAGGKMGKETAEDRASESFVMTTNKLTRFSACCFPASRSFASSPLCQWCNPAFYVARSGIAQSAQGAQEAPPVRALPDPRVGSLHPRVRHGR